MEGGFGELAVELFSLMLEDDPALRVDLRIASGFAALAKRGYVKLLLDAGPQVLAFGARHGIRTLGSLRRFVAQLRSRGRQSWERPAH